jgi:hypothetical protein
MGEEIQSRAERSDRAVVEETPLTGASRAGTPPRPPRAGRRRTETPTLPPGAR